MRPLMIEQRYKDWHIIIARNHGRTTINAYSDSVPVQQVTGDSLEEVENAIDNYKQMC